MPLARSLQILGDWLAFSSLLPAAIAAGLYLSAAFAMAVPADWATTSLVAFGTLFVYNVDRLRDTADDRESAPLRTAFIERHRKGLWLWTGVAAAASAALALGTPREVQILCLGVLAIGLLHRRLKRRQAWKPLYVGAAWVAVTAGIPSLESRDLAPVPWVIGLYTATLGANLIASKLRASGPPGAPLWLARGLAAAGVIVALAGPSGAMGLTAIPACELAALAAFRPGERYGLVVVDGALLVGAVLTLVGAR